MKNAKNFFEDDVELKHYLDELGVRFGEGYSNQYFCAVFFDGVSGSPITMPSMARSPLVFARDFPDIAKKSQINVVDVRCKLLFSARYSGDMKDTYEDFVSLGVWISPYVYYKKEESKDTK